MKQAELNKLISSITKKEAKLKKWKSITGMPFWRSGNLFFNLLIASSAREKSLYLVLRFKWHNIDNQLWHVLGMTENFVEPESLHASGAFTIFGHDILVESLENCEWSNEWLSEQISSFFSLSDSTSKEFANNKILSIDDYLEYLKHDYAELLKRQPNTAYNIWLESMLIAIEKEDYALAEEIAIDRLESNDSGGFFVEDKSTYKHAIKYISRLAKQQKHNTSIFHNFLAGLGMKS